MSQATRDARAAEVAAKQAGTGKIVFQNATQSDIILPKPSYDSPAKRSIGPGEMFTGDSYHNDHMRGLIKIVQVIQSTIEAPAAPTDIEAYDSASGSVKKVAVAEAAAPQLPSRPADLSEVSQANDVIGTDTDGLPLD